MLLRKKIITFVENILILLNHIVMKKFLLAIVMLSVVVPSWAQWSGDFERMETTPGVVVQGDQEIQSTLVAAWKKSKKSKKTSQQTPRAKLYKKYNDKHVDLLYKGIIRNGMDASLIMEFFDLNPNLGEYIASSYDGLYNLGVKFYGGKSYFMFFEDTVFDVVED